MATQVDERVVQMKFNNQQFEQGAKQTIETLDKLKESLNMKGATKGFEEIEKASKKADFSVMQKSLEKIEHQFSVVGIAGMTMISNLVNSAVNAGKRMAKALTIEPVTDGFKEYELKMGSVQTIMASTGESLQTVNRYLEELNAYSDRTIYSFSDMTSNIGKFTNAGVKLEDAVAAIQGISNEAAISGANANEASRAMYNFAQALSTGAVKLIDWKSIENANMATVEFKNQLIETALEVGTIVEKEGMYVSTTTDLQGKVSDAFTATTRFNDSLSSQWMTTDVLVKTLKKYTDETTDLGKKAFAAAQDVKTFSQLMDTLKEAVGSGWASTWEIVFGDFNEAKELWTDVNNVVSQFIDTVSSSRNELLRGGLSTGWKNFTHEYVSDAETLKNEINEVARTQIEGFDKMVEKAGGFDNSLEKGWLTTDILSQAIQNLENRLSGLSAAQLEEIGYTQAQQREFTGLWTKVQNGIIDLKDLEKQISRVSGRKNLITGLANVFRGLLTILYPIHAAFVDLFPPLTAQRLYQFTASFAEFTSKLRLSNEAMYTLKVAVKAIILPFKLAVDVFEVVLYTAGLLALKLWELIDALLAIPSKTKVVGGAIENALGSENYERLTNALSGIIQRVIDAFMYLKNAAIETYTSIMQNEKVQDILSRIQSVLKDIGKNGLEIIISGLEQLAKFDLVSLPEAIGKAFETAWEAVKKFFSLFNLRLPEGNGLDTVNAEVGNMRQVLASAAPVVNSFAGDTLQLSGAMVTIDGTLKSFIDRLVNFLNNLSAGKIILYAFGAAMTGVVYSSITAMNTITDASATVIKSFNLILTNVASSVTKFTTSGTNLLDALTKKFKPSVTKDFQAVMIGLSIGLISLTIALGVLSKIPMDTLSGVVVRLSVVLGVLFAGIETLIITLGVIVKKAPEFAGVLLEFAAVVVSFAVSVGILVLALEKLNSIQFESIGEKLLYFAGFMSVVIMAIFAISKVLPGMTEGAITILAFALGINTLMRALQNLAQSDMTGINKNIGALVITVGMFGTMAALASHIKFGGTVGLLLFIADISLMVKTLEAMSEVDMNKIVTGIVNTIPLMVVIGELMLATSAAGEHAAKAGVALAFMSGGILILAQAIEQLGKIDTGAVAKGVIAVDAILLVFGEVASNLSNTSVNANKAGHAILMMSVAILGLQFAVKYLGMMDLQSLAKGILAVDSILGMFSLVLMAANKAQASTGVVLALTFCIGILTTSIAMLTALAVDNGQQMVAAAVSLGVTLLALSKAFETVHDIDMKNVTKLVGGLAGVMFVIGAALWALDGLSIESKQSTVNALCSILGTMSIAARILNGGKGANGEQGTSAADVTKAKITAALMAEFLILAVAALAALDFASAGSNITPQMALANATALSEVLLAISLCTKIMNGESGGSDWKAAGTTMAEIGEFLVLAALALAGLDFASAGSGITPQMALVNATALSEVLLAISLCSRIMNGEAGGSDWKAAGITMLEIGVFLGEAVAALAILNKLDGNDPVQMIANATALSVVLLAVGRVTALVSTIGGIAGSAGVMAGVKGVVIVMGAIAALCTAFGALTHIKGFEDLLSRGVTVFRKLGECVGELIGGVLVGAISGFTGSVGDGIKKLGEDLGEFGVSILPFVTTMKLMNGQVLEGIGVLTGAILALTASDFIMGLENIAKWFFGGGTGTFADQLSEFTEPLIQFAQDITAANLDPASVNAAANLGSMIADLESNLPREGGVLQWWIGDKQRLGIFSNGLKKFAEAIVEYSQAISQVSDWSAIEQSVTYAKMLTGLNDNLPATGGKLQEWLGSKDLSVFSARIVLLASGLVSYGRLVSEADIDWGIVEKSAAMGQLLADLNDSLPPTGGALQSFLGEKNMTTFGQQLIDFGCALDSYASVVTSSAISETTVSKSQQAADIINTLNEALPENTSLKSLLFGGVDVADWGAFSTALTNIGEGIKKFAEAVNSVTLNGSDPKTMIQFLGQDLVQALIDGIDSMQDNVSSAGTTTGQAFAQAITDYTKDMQSRMVAFGNAARDQLTTTLGVSPGTSTVFYDIGRNVGAGFIQGVESKSADLKKTMTQMAKDARTAAETELEVDSPSKVFYRIGDYVVQGLANGVKENTSIGTKAMVKMGDSLLQAEKDFWKIKSPSIVAKEEIGEFIIKGIAEGITEDMSAEEAAKQKAQNILQAFENELGKNDNKQSIEDSMHEYWQLLNPETDDMTEEQKLDQYNENMRHLQDTARFAANDLHDYDEAIRVLEENNAPEEVIEEAQAKRAKQLVELAKVAKEMVDLTNDYNDALHEVEKTNSQAQRQADQYMKDYNEEWVTFRDTALGFGYTMDQIKEKVYKDFGYDVSKAGYMEQSIGSIQDIIDDYIITTTGNYTLSLEDATKKATGTAVARGVAGANWGGAANSIGTNISAAMASPSVQSTISKGVQTNVLGAWFDGFNNFDASGTVAGTANGIIDGLSSWGTSIRNSGIDAAGQLIGGFDWKMLIRSPSKVMMERGEYIVDGLILGIQEKQQSAIDTMTNLFAQGLINATASGNQVATSFMDGFYQAAANGEAAMQESLGGTLERVEENGPLYYEGGMSIGDQLTNGLTTAIQNGIPAITQAAADAAQKAFEAAMARLNGGESTGGTTSLGSTSGNIATSVMNSSSGGLFASTSSRLAGGLSESTAKAIRDAQARGERVSQEALANANTYYNFTQNITSPKPVSRTEIYRDTSNLFSRTVGSGSIGFNGRSNSTKK